MIDWNTLYSDDFSYKKNCWEGGCESYCCSGWSQVSRNFAFLEGNGGPVLPMFAGEYEFLKQRSLLQDTFEEAHRNTVFKLQNGAAISLDSVICKLQGICSAHEWRPTVCRLYPFAPKVTIDGEIIGVQKMNLYDHLWDDLSTATPCTVLTMSGEAEEGFYRLCRRLLQDPKNTFLFMAWSLFVQTVVDGTRDQKLELPDTTADSFFSHWEKLFLLGKLFDRDRLNADLTALHDQFVQHHGAAFAVDSAT